MLSSLVRVACLTTRGAAAGACGRRTFGWAVTAAMCLAAAQEAVLRRRRLLPTAARSRRTSRAWLWALA